MDSNHRRVLSGLFTPRLPPNHSDHPLICHNYHYPLCSLGVPTLRWCVARTGLEPITRRRRVGYFRFGSYSAYRVPTHLTLDHYVYQFHHLAPIEQPLGHKPPWVSQGFLFIASSYYLFKWITKVRKNYLTTNSS